MTEFTPEWIEEQKKLMEEYSAEGVFENPNVDYSKELDILYEYYPNALSEIQRLQSRVQELEAEQRWIPVSEWKLVSSIDLYWVVDNNLCYHEAYRFEGKWYTYSGDNRIYPTHYRQLPKPPKDRSQ